ncbi:MAG: serine hydrolase [Parasporobacterium sp.]|nr:serine hydrolase [Parasporobacterium sp.]
MKKKSAVLILILSVFLSVLVPAPADQDGPDVLARSYCVLNLQTGEIVIQKNMDEVLFPASITKIMTALITLENCDDLKKEIVFSDYAVNSLTANSSTLSPKASVGEVMSVENALYGMMLSSANECANALAEFTSGSIEAFCEKMNEKAASLGAVNSHFVNPHGLHDDNHYTTSHDMALIFREAMKNVDFARLVSTVNYTIPKTNLNEARECVNTHRLVNGAIECAGVYAGKTGNTVQAGRTLVTAANRYGVDLVCVLMRSDNDHFYTDTQIIFEYAFGKATGSYPSVSFSPRDDNVVASADGLRLREFPSVYSTIVSSLMSGNTVHRVGTIAGWSAVEDSGMILYAATDYLRTPEGETVEPPFETIPPTESSTAEQIPETISLPAADEPVTETQMSITETDVQDNKEEVTRQSAQEVREQSENDSDASHSYEVSQDVLRNLILGVIVLIAILAGALVAILIIRKGE